MKLKQFAVKGRQFTMLFDADLTFKESVNQALDQLGFLLSETGGNVSIGLWQYTEQTKGIDDLILEKGADVIQEVLDDAKPYTSWSKKTQKAHRGKDNQSVRSEFVQALLTDFAVEIVKTLRTDEVYLKIKHPDKGVEVLPLDGHTATRFIQQCAMHVSGVVMKPEDLNLIKTTLNTIAYGVSTPKLPIYKRVGRLGNSFYIDSGNENFDVYKISGDGVTCLQSSDEAPLFDRQKTQLAIVTPNLSATPLESFNALKSLTERMTEEDIWLLWYFMLYTLTDLPDRPVLMLTGKQGSGKTEVGEMVKNLVDPSSIDKLSVPEDEKTLLLQAESHWTLLYDNLSPGVMTGKISDLLCRLAMGAAMQTKTLYKDKETTVIEAQRTLVLTGIENVIRRPDLLDRAVVLNVPKPTKTLSRERMEVRTKLSMPIILGGMMNALSQYLKAKDDLFTLDLDWSRMADFHEFSAIVEHQNNLPSDFTKQYAANKQEGTEKVLESDPVAQCLMMLLDKPEFVYGWKGTAQELLTDLNVLKRMYLPDTDRTAWVADGAKLSNRLTRIEDALTANDYVIIRKSERREGKVVRMIHLYKKQFYTLQELINHLQTWLNDPNTKDLFAPDTLDNVNAMQYKIDNLLPIKIPNKETQFATEEGYVPD